VRLKVRSWLLLLVVAAVVAASIAGGLWYQSRSLTPVALMKRLPTGDALVLFADFGALRSSGVLELLQGSKAGEDPEYQSFARRIGLDYARDLDTVLAAFAPTGKYFLVKGRFDWKSLDGYVQSQGGRCEGSLCRMTGSAPERRISFFPLRRNLMALAVSQDDSAALRLNTSISEPESETPDAPVWLSIPTSALKARESLPEGTLMFASNVARAESLTLGFVRDGNRYAIRINVRCRNEQDATQVAADLTGTTDRLRKMIERENQKPNPADLSGVLVAGVFRAEGRRVLGSWPIERVLLQTVLGGGR